MNDNDIEVFTWVPYSPDINLIENVWAFLKNKLHEIKNKIRGKKSLKFWAEHFFYT
jgi:transposase